MCVCPIQFEFSLVIFFCERIHKSYDVFIKSSIEMWKNNKNKFTMDRIVKETVRGNGFLQENSHFREYFLSFFTIKCVSSSSKISSTFLKKNFHLKIVFSSATFCKSEKDICHRCRDERNFTIFMKFAYIKVSYYY